jgi:hypothetical protein
VWLDEMPVTARPNKPKDLTKFEALAAKIKECKTEEEIKAAAKLLVSS